jgi:hypothetical protein
VKLGTMTANANPPGCPTRHAWRAAALIVVAALSAAPAYAQASSAMDSRFTKGEWAVLPDWCIDSQAGPFGGPEGGAGLNRSPRAAQWVAAMGTDFWHMHHYCYALRDRHRLKSAVLTPRERTFLIGRAIRDIDYVLSNAGPKMPLLPELLYRQGELYVMQQNLGAASDAFARSRELKPDYWPSYVAWIDVLIGMKNFEAAAALTEQGLSAAGEVAALRERRAALKTKTRAPSAASARRAHAAATSASSPLAAASAPK